MYSGLSQIYCIVSGGRIHQNTKGYGEIAERIKRIVEKPFIPDPFKKMIKPYINERATT